ncbi:MAG: toxin-antitoxin system, toxin component, PIN family protein [Dehalococcoidia bacterium]|nr:toxin-antitoxin system, toxin component, PIN family protein [Dehalococcoidia bacterium]
MFFLDVSASSRSMRDTLTRLGHDVVSASDMAPGTADEEILVLAAEEGRILVTEDKDFGELVFVRRLPHPCIIRFTEMRVEEKVAAIVELIDLHADAMNDGAMIVVTRSQYRIRHI